MLRAALPAPRSPLNAEKRDGVFHCAGCGAPLFNASQKYESGTGWPSFFDTLPGGAPHAPSLRAALLLPPCAAQISTAK